MAEGCGPGGGDFRNIDIKVWGSTMDTVKRLFGTYRRAYPDEVAAASAIDFVANAAHLAVEGPGGRYQLKVINPANGQLVTLDFEQKS